MANTVWTANRRALGRWYPDLLHTLKPSPRTRAGASPTRGPSRWRATVDGRAISLRRAGSAPSLIVLGFGGGPRLARWLARRPAGTVTLIVEPDRERFRALLGRRDLTPVFARRGLKLAVGDDPLRIAAAVLSLPAWVSPAVVDVSPDVGRTPENAQPPLRRAASARVRRVIDGALALARARRAEAAAERRRWVGAIRRDPRRLFRLPVVCLP